MNNTIIKTDPQNYVCDYCNTENTENTKKIEINIPVSPSVGGYGASFKDDHEEIDYVFLCDNCVDSELEFCADCGYAARLCDAAIYSECDVERGWKCDNCFSKGGNEVGKTERKV